MKKSSVWLTCLLLLCWHQNVLAESATFVLGSSPHIQFTQAESQLVAQIDTELGQTNIELKLKLADLYMLFDRVDLLQPLLSDLEQQLTHSSNPIEKLQWHTISGYVKFFSGQYSAANQHFDEAIEQHKLLTSEFFDDSQLAYFYHYIVLLKAVNLAYLQDYNQSIALLTDVHRQADQWKWPLLKARAVYYLGDVNYELKNYEQALVQYQDAYKLYPKDYAVYLTQALMSQAQMINVVGQRSEAFQLLEQSISQLKALDHKDSLAFAYLLKSYFFSKQGDNEQSLQWIAKSVQIREQLGVPIDLANAYVHYSARLSDAKQQEEAIKFAMQAAELVESTENLSGQWDAYNNLAGILNQAGRYQQAYHFMHLSERALLAKARLDITSETARLNTEFNLAKEQIQNQYLDEQKILLEQRNSLLNDQLKLKQAQQSKQQWALFIMFVALVVFLILLVIIYWLYRKSKVLATTDTLTGLHNRRHIFELGEQAFSSNQRYQHGLCVLMLDVDNFKDVNDQHGHEKGDQVLIMVAKACKRSLRDSDLVGRIGGEEFLFILSHVDEQTAIALAERIRVDIASLSKETFGKQIEVSVSIGLATQRHHNEHLASLINEADMALYQAKNSGRNQVQVFKQSMLRGSPSHNYGDPVSSS